MPVDSVPTSLVKQYVLRNSGGVCWSVTEVVSAVKDQAIMYLLLILAMSVMAGATLVRAAKACFEGVWLERWKSAATPGYASRCGLHHVQTFGKRVRVLHSSDGRALPHRSQDRLRKNFHRRSDGAVQLYKSYALSTSWTHCLEVGEKEARAPQDDGGRRQMYRSN